MQGEMHAMTELLGTCGFYQPQPATNAHQNAIRLPQQLARPPTHLLAAHIADLAAAEHRVQVARRKGAQQLVAEEAEVVGGHGGAQAGGGVQQHAAHHAHVLALIPRLGGRRGCGWVWRSMMQRA